MRWLRTHLTTDEHDNADMTLDLLVDDGDIVVDRVPFCGWWGRLNSTELLPIVVRPDGRVDFGSDDETDQGERYGFMRLRGRRLQVGEPFSLEWEDEYLLLVKSCRDLTEGLI